MDDADIRRLQTMIRERHGCHGQHIVSRGVAETFQDQRWEGTVEIFALRGHPQARRAYAWSRDDAGDSAFVTVIGVAPINTPEDAVRSALQELSDHP